MSSFLCGILYVTLFSVMSAISYLCIFVLAAKRAQNAGDLSEGPHPFPFRTRKLSLLEPMVLLRGESR